jgi:thiamine pyrophosphate-dependent acetolactate synthase large subunit-like protein
LADEQLAYIRDIPPSGHIHPGRLMLEARQAVPDEAVIVLDGGLTIFYQLAFFEKRGRDFLYCSNFSHLGTGIPYAIGAQLAHGRDQPVCLISGDGALGFQFMEFETAVRHRLPIVIIVNDDHALGAEMAAHMQHIGHGIEVEFEPVRYDKMAQAIGGYGEYVDKADDIQPAIRRAFASGQPAIVQVVTDPDASHAHVHPYASARRSWLFADLEHKYGAP